MTAHKDLNQIALEVGLTTAALTYTKQPTPQTIFLVTRALVTTEYELGKPVTRDWTKKPNFLAITAKQLQANVLELCSQAPVEGKYLSAELEQCLNNLHTHVMALQLPEHRAPRRATA